MKNLACVSPLIYHSLVTSMQIGKQRKTSPAHQPLLCIGCQLPDVWGEQLHQQGEVKRSWQEKGAKIEAYPPSGISFVSFSPFNLDSVLSSVMRGGGGGGVSLRQLPGGTPGLSQHQLHICSLVADTLMTLADPRMKALIKNLSSSGSLIPYCQKTAHGPLTHCQPNETSALMKPLWALLVRQQRAMKTLTIHFMDWAVVRTDNTGLINETGLASRRKGGGHKSATGDSIQRKAKGLG